MNWSIIRLSISVLIFALIFAVQVYAVTAADESGASSGDNTKIEVNSSDNQAAVSPQTITQKCEGQGEESAESEQKSETTQQEEASEDVEENQEVTPEEEQVEEVQATESEPTSESEAASVEEQVSEPIEVTYLDDILDHEGWLTLTLKLNESGDDSYFYNRYQDPFSGDSLYLGEAYYRGWNRPGARIRFAMQDTWERSQMGSLMWNLPGRFQLNVRYDNYDNTTIPSTFAATRTDFVGSVDAYRSGNSFGAYYAHHANQVFAPSGSIGAIDWETNGVGADFDFNWIDWQGNIEVNYKTYGDHFNDTADIQYTNGTVRLGRNFGDDTYIEGNASYNLSNRETAANLESYRIGGYLRYTNTHGPNRFLLTSHMNWVNTNDGPSKLHPVGDQFNFDLNCRWRPVHNLSLQGAWNHQVADYTHADQFTNFGFYTHPDWPTIPGSRFFEDSITTDRWSFGGVWDINDNLKFTADYDRVNRDDLPSTDFVRAGSPTLWWELENRYVFTLRYNQGSIPGVNSGDWFLKYDNRERENGSRGSTSSVEQFSINWTGMINPDLWLYAGGGYFTMDNSITGSATIKQNGPEYGGGLSWNLSDLVTFYGDFWMYNVGGNYGYDETSLAAGLSYRLNDDWNWSLDYDRVEGNFTDLTNLDYTVENLRLSLTYNW